MIAAISLELTDLGWAKIHIRIGGKIYSGPGISYCTDAFGDLARLALCAATGASRSEASFELEPGELRIVLTRQSANDSACLLSVVEFPDYLHPPSPESEGRLCFGTEIDDRDFAQGMLAALDLVWNTYGQDQFNARWQGRRGFPVAATEALRRALEVTDPKPYDEAFEEMWAELIDEAAED